MDKYYKRNFDQILARYQQIRNVSRGALLHIDSIDEINRQDGVPKVKPLNTWDFDKEQYAFYDALFAREEYIWSRRTDVEDDRIPSVFPRFGIAEHSAYVGLDVIMEETTSYPVPLIKEWSDIDKITWNEDNVWFRRVVDGIAYFKKKGEGRIAPRLRGGCSPADIANAIRGNDLFLDFYEEPEAVHRLLKICVEAERWFIEQQLKVHGDFEGGILDGMNLWVPHGSFGHLSEDWSVMCSPDMYCEFGRQYTEEMTEGLHDVIMHVHSAGAHVLPEMAKSKNLTYIQISSDPNRPTAIETFKKYEACLKDKILVLETTLEELKKEQTFLQDKRVVLSMTTSTVEEAKRLVDYVRTQFPLQS